MGDQFFDREPASEGLWFPDQASPTQQLFYESIATFAQDTVGPAEAALASGDYALARALFEECAELGVFAAELDEADGGLGFGVLDATILAEALGRANSLAVGLTVHQGVGMLPVASFGSDAQRARYLPEAAAGRCIMAFALTEPQCGSDALALATAATPQGAGYVLNGNKQFITNAGYADCFITFARIPDVGITAFLVDGGTPGLSIGPEEHKLGQHASSTCSVIYEDVWVEANALLGTPGEGHKIALNMLNLGRLKLAAAAVGKMKTLLPEALAYTEERTAFGEPIIAFGMLRDRLARMASLLYAAESTVYRVASRMDRALAVAQGDTAALGIAERLRVLQDFALECALVKSFATESLGTFSDDMLQLYGGYGFSEEYPAAKAFRDARVTRLYEGTTEICRLTIMRRLIAQCCETPKKTDGPATGFAGQKEILGSVIRHHVEAQAGDLQGILAKQALTNPIVSIAERIYAAESVALRTNREDLFGKALSDYFSAQANADNLADFHRMAGSSTAKDPATFFDSRLFPMVDTVELRDRIVACLRDTSGHIGDGLG